MIFDSTRTIILVEAQKYGHSMIRAKNKDLAHNADFSSQVFRERSMRSRWKFWTWASQCQGAFLSMNRVERSSS